MTSKMHDAKDRKVRTRQGVKGMVKMKGLLLSSGGCIDIKDVACMSQQENQCLSQMVRSSGGDGHIQNPTQTHSCKASFSSP
jgi:hypothetical protein